MNGPSSVVQINISRGGIPKRPVSEAMLAPLGLEGDSCAHPRFHGGPLKAVLLIASETIEQLIAKGYPVFFGALGENLTTRGLDYRQLRQGERLRIGAALIELTTIRAPCGTLDLYGPSIKNEIYDLQVKAGDFTSPRWALSGFYARVIAPGPIRAGDAIIVESVLA
ncbi:MAG: MOSC domain-containing protein [Acidobacteriota bacterium]|nr:MOSC domain-containing protein [Acidobacteriota bacterium]